MNSTPIKPDEYFFRDDDEGSLAYQRQLEAQEQEIN
jgi:hypothetical protein